MSCVWAVASAFGPLIGGGITEGASWRWCFWINRNGALPWQPALADVHAVPLDFISLILLIVFLDIYKPKTPLKKGLLAIDWSGTFTFATASILLILGLQFGGVNYPWDSAIVVCLIVFGIITFGLFALTQWKVAQFPLMPLQIFQSGHILLTLFIHFCSATNATAVTFYLPFYFQIILGSSPVLSGVYLLPFVLVLGTFSVTTGMIIRKCGDYT